MRSIIVSSTLACALATSALAQDFDNGMAAFQAFDFETAKGEFLPLAEEGDAQAQFILGYIYFLESRDPAEVERWYRLAAEQGHAEAQYMLGLMYMEGGGLPQDDAEAARWTRLAAEQGFARAQHRLGLMYRRGEAVPQDDAEAIRWYRLAAQQGFDFAQAGLGFMYENGRGVPQDLVFAHMWYDIADANGYPDAQAAIWRDNVAAMLTAADLAQARRRASACMTSGYTDCN